MRCTVLSVLLALIAVSRAAAQGGKKGGGVASKAVVDHIEVVLLTVQAEASQAPVKLFIGWGPQ